MTLRACVIGLGWAAASGLRLPRGKRLRPSGRTLGVASLMRSSARSVALGRRATDMANMLFICERTGVQSA